MKCTVSQSRVVARPSDRMGVGASANGAAAVYAAHGGICPPSHAHNFRRFDSNGACSLLAQAPFSAIAPAARAQRRRAPFFAIAPAACVAWPGPHGDGRRRK